MDKKDYLDLITSEYYNKPKFYKTTEELLNLASKSAEVLSNFWEYFNLNTAVGNQLDVLGMYLNITRSLPVDSEEIPAILPDETFRIVLKSRVLQYRWDGSIQGLYDIISSLYPNMVIWLQDNADMSYTVFVMTDVFDEYVAELFLLGYILPKPAGIKVNYVLYERPFFTWDESTEHYKGWDEGAWMR